MNVVLLTRLAALAIAMFWVLEGVTNSLGLFIRVQDRTHSDQAIIFLAFIPTILAVLMGLVFYRSARKIDHPAQEHLATDILYAGIKLLAIFLLVRGIPSLLSAIALSFNSQTFEHDRSNFIYNASLGLSYCVSGLILLIRTKWLLSIITRDAPIQNPSDDTLPPNK